jgi:hypothetical protein
MQKNGFVKHTGDKEHIIGKVIYIPVIDKALRNPFPVVDFPAPCLPKKETTNNGCAFNGGSNKYAVLVTMCPVSPSNPANTDAAVEGSKSRNAESRSTKIPSLIVNFVAQQNKLVWKESSMFFSNCLEEESELATPKI